ncbi:MAG TPA: sugar O-acetyltransferase [Thermoanaerobaculia bacterium]|nr:sugar O-acetyltransferase [Thermoanaerobaculia bacterium]
MPHLSEKDKMLAGELYLAGDEQLVQERRRAKELCRRYNGGEPEAGAAILEELLASAAGVYLEPPFFCDYGYNIRFGPRSYANHHLVILDCAAVTIGSEVFIGPNVVLSTAGHPVEPSVRVSGLEFAKPIVLEDRVWIGAGVVVLPGVTIGANTTVGAGSVVTRSIPGNCVAAGNPCRVLRGLDG